MVETKDGNNSEILSAEQKRTGFHAKYLEMCKLKNLMPLAEVKAKQRNVQVLDFHADRIKPHDWLPICNALSSDKSLKFIAIRLRKNTELVLEEIDTLKKTKAIVSHPVIYSKFLFSELVTALQSLMTNNCVLETLILEGLPLSGRYMSTLCKGLSQNTSIRTLNLTRSKIRDEACETICGTLKHLINIQSLNLSGCDLGVKGAEAVSDLVKFQKIQRFSEAWTKSLRYQAIDAESFQGLRKIILSNNTQIGNEGVEHLTEILIEDVWIKDIEMQNCGLSDDGAQHIIKCLNINKTILNFNIGCNPEVSEHLYRHILVHLGNAEQERSSDSNDSKTSSEKITKFKLLDNVKFLEEQLDNEIFKRKQMEILNEKLSKQLVEFQKELSIQGSFKIPDGFTLVSNDTLEDLLNDNEKPVVTKSPQVKVPGHRHRKRRALIPKRVKSSYVIAKPSVDVGHMSKSEVVIKLSTDDKNRYMEKNIGDNVSPQQPLRGDKTLTGAQLLQMFVKKKKEDNRNDCTTPTNAKDFDPRSLFSNRGAKRVPNNSDVDSDD